MIKCHLPGCPLHGHGAVSFYNPLDILTHACYGLNEKCSSWTHVLNVCAHSVVLRGEDGEPAGGKDPLAENRLLGTHTPLKVKPGPWFLSYLLLPGWPGFEQAALHHMLETKQLRKYGFNYGAVPMCKDGRQSFLPRVGAVQYFSTAIYHALTTAIISVDMEAGPEGSSW